jgi:hypothetical protein
MVSSAWSGKPDTILYTRVRCPVFQTLGPPAFDQPGFLKKIKASGIVTIGGK